MIKISAFMIVKNEEATLECALKSLVSLADEIIIVDTGSTDRTKAIAAEYTPHLYDFNWIDDFAAARNFALSKCHGDWIIFLDADDEIETSSQQKIKKLLNEDSPEVIGYYLNYRYASDKNILSQRLFRNHLDLKFSMPVHEHLELTAKMQKKIVVKPEIEIIHHKEASENGATLERNISILEKALQKTPNNDHLQFFLGREFLNTKKHNDALATFLNLLKTTSNPDKTFLYKIYLHLGQVQENLNNFNEAHQAYQKAHNLDSRFAEPLICEANLYLYQEKSVEKAKQLYEQSLKIPLPQSAFAINPHFYHQFPKAQLKKIAELAKPAMLICGYYGKLNFGDELILDTILKNFPDYRKIVASYSPKITQELHKVESVAHHHDYFEQALELAEIVLIGGGGLFHDQGLKENKNVEYYCGLIEKAALKNKKIVLFGIGVATIKIADNQELIKRNFAKCHAIFVRDLDSKVKLIDCGVVANKITVIPDIVFGSQINIPTPSTNQIPRQKPLIGINVCPSIINNGQNLMAQIDQFLIPFIKANQEKYDFKFIPANQDDLKYLPYFDKIFAANKIHIKLSVFTPNLTNYFNDYFRELEKCDVIIASRYHFLVAGVLLQKPTYALSYSDKTDSLIKEFPNQLKLFQGSLNDIQNFQFLDQKAYSNKIEAAIVSIKSILL